MKSLSPLLLPLCLSFCLATALASKDIQGPKWSGGAEDDKWENGLEDGEWAAIAKGEILKKPRSDIKQALPKRGPNRDLRSYNQKGPDACEIAQRMCGGQEPGTGREWDDPYECMSCFVTHVFRGGGCRKAQSDFFEWANAQCRHGCVPSSVCESDNKERMCGRMNAGCGQKVTCACPKGSQCRKSRCVQTSSDGMEEPMTEEEPLRREDACPCRKGFECRDGRCEAAIRRPDAAKRRPELRRELIQMAVSKERKARDPQPRHEPKPREEPQPREDPPAKQDPPAQQDPQPQNPLPQELLPQITKPGNLTWEEVNQIQCYNHALCRAYFGEFYSCDFARNRCFSEGEAKCRKPGDTKSSFPVCNSYFNFPTTKYNVNGYKCIHDLTLRNPTTPVCVYRGTPCNRNPCTTVNSVENSLPLPGCLDPRNPLMGLVCREHPECCSKAWTKACMYKVDYCYKR